MLLDSSSLFTSYKCFSRQTNHDAAIPDLLFSSLLPTTARRPSCCGVPISNGHWRSVHTDSTAACCAVLAATVRNNAATNTISRGKSAINRQQLMAGASHGWPPLDHFIVTSTELITIRHVCFLQGLQNLINLLQVCSLSYFNSLQAVYLHSSFIFV